MGRTRRSVVFGLYLFFGYIMSAVPIVGEIHGCKEEHRDCIRCDSSHHCTKCTRLIVVGTRQCVDRCPSGYREEWSSFVSYMGRICRETGFLGLPGRTLAIVVGAFSGAAICMGILLGGYLYLRHRKHCETKAGILRSTRDQDRRLECEMEERYEFLKHLAALRCEAPVFLAMLNDTRRQVRELHQNTGHSDTAVQAYLPVLKDLARILTLLNRPDHTIYRPPSDWEKLLAWSERVLRRYKKQNHYQVQELPLVSFLPVPIQTNQRSSPSVSISPEPNHRALTTFQPVQGTPKPNTGSNHHSTSTVASHNLQDMAISAFDNNYNNSITSHDAVLRLQNTSLIDSDFNACWEFNPSNYTILAEWSASQDYLVDDDFFTLGFRPQDEITTEL